MVQRVDPDVSHNHRQSHPFAHTRYAAETELLLHCARTQLAPERAARVRETAQQVRDWPYVFDLAVAHGVMPLLYIHLKAACSVASVFLCGFSPVA